MKNNILFCFLCLFNFAFGQKTWNQRLPWESFSSIPYIGVYPENDRYLYAAQDKIVEQDQDGAITGDITIGDHDNYINFASKRYDAATQSYYFIYGGTRLPMPINYSLRIFKPGRGVTSELAFPDSLNNYFYGCPTVLTLDDNTIMVFGRKNVTKVRINSSDSLSVVWQMPLQSPERGYGAAVLLNNGDFMLLNVTGEVAGLSKDGLQYFKKTHPFAFRGAALVSDGVVACGWNSDEKAVLVKLDFEGNLIWSQVYEDQKYYDVVTVADGSIIVTGESANGNIILIKTSSAGDQLWAKEYQSGAGLKLRHTDDGGYLIFAIAYNPGYKSYGIKTDASGETGPQENKFYSQNRGLKSASVHAVFEPTAALFRSDIFSGLAPASSDNKSTVFTFAPWIGGIDPGGSLHLAAETFGPFPSQFDFISGFCSGAPGDFNRVWMIKKAQIDALRKDFLLDHIVDDMVPFDILTWPAKGNPHCKFNLDYTRIMTEPSRFAAPFVDWNGDGIYNVYDGDYPQIKGDQMAWWALNDDVVHTKSYGAPLKIDMAISAYIYDCQENTTVDGSVFVDFLITNRADVKYDSSFIGFFTDFDLGCLADDLNGSLEDVNAMYVYNNTVVDENCTAGSFGADIPLVSLSYLNKSMDKLTCFDIGGVTGSFPRLLLYSPLSYYHYLNGRLTDGSRPTWGGTGNNPGSTNYVDKVFPSNPSDLQGWSMCTANLHPGDIVALNTHGPFAFAPGEKFSISLAFTIHEDIPLPCPDVFSWVKPSLLSLSALANNGGIEASPNLGGVQTIKPGEQITLGSEIAGAQFIWSTGVTTPTITVSSPGEYTVTVTNQAGCRKVESVTVRNAKNINQGGTYLDWGVCPNPASDFVQIVFPEEALFSPCQMVLSDALGRVLKETPMKYARTKLDLQELPNGFYWLELRRDGKSLGSTKIIHAKQ